VLDYLRRNLSARFKDEVEAIGHRVVHGREISDPLLIDDHVIEAIRHASNLAPLHNPPNLEGIFAAQNVFGSCPQVRGSNFFKLSCIKTPRTLT
jgi:acetate kinase